MTPVEMPVRTCGSLGCTLREVTILVTLSGGQLELGNEEDDEKDKESSVDFDSDFVNFALTPYFRSSLKSVFFITELLIRL